jgi:5'-methylthioadenosine nucleosidase
MTAGYLFLYVLQNVLVICVKGLCMFIIRVFLFTTEMLLGWL